MKIEKETSSFDSLTELIKVKNEQIDILKSSIKWMKKQHKIV